jgi:putative redox protein
MATITADLVGGYAVTISNDRHRWAADEPRDLGGTDSGPTPYELLLGSLAACTSITLAMYAERKGIALDSISTRYHYERVHADDCASCDDDLSGWLDHVTSEIYLDGRFTDEEATRMEQIAQRCPVHKTLANGITFTESVVVG